MYLFEAPHHLNIYHVNVTNVYIHKPIYLSGKRFIPFGQKVYTFRRVRLRQKSKYYLLGKVRYTSMAK